MKIKIFTVLWCPSCLIMNPKYDNIIKNNPQVEFVKYDFEDYKEEFVKHDIGNVYVGESEVVRIVRKKINKELAKLLEGIINV